MKHSELVSKVNKDIPQIYIETTDEAIKVIFKTIMEAVRQGRKVQIRKFGNFFWKKKYYPKWNGKTEKDPFEGQSNVYYRMEFKPSSFLKDYINGKEVSLKNTRKPYEEWDIKK